jgi:osmoprotectant transport system ATP-binding protein
VAVTPPALAARGAEVVYPGGTRALAGVDLEVAEGETVALVGESGSGKTTLLRLFNRTVEATGGQVEVAGAPVADQDPVALRRRLGYVPQDGGLLPHWTVERNVELVPRLLGWPAVRRRQRAREALSLVGLSPDALGGRHPRQLSGGQRQRVAIARALAAEPAVILLDEPLGALDALTRRELQGELRRLERELGRTMLLVTHDLDEAFRLADRVAVLKDGLILQVGTPDEVRRRPEHAYVAALVAMMGGEPA